MQLQPGLRVGPYEILSALGAGGMGEVYRARDTKLGRDVAIKILPRAFTTDPDRLARFEREARALATLNHPNIGAIYGLEEYDASSSGQATVRALVLELVEGETLADRIRRGLMPLKEALAVARQIADAIEAAHEKGIVHRDLKPANIKVTPDGVVKVLDFGLAKAAAGDAPAPDLTHSPTVTSGGTHDGMILGTPAYMSPEQARGLAVDKRTDIWAFGCVLYEMLTGRAPFAGHTISDTIAAILEREPDWSASPAATPAPIRRLLLRCLDKNAKRRLRDIGEARMVLDDSAVGDTRSDVSAAGVSIEPPRALWRRAIPVVLAGVVTGALSGTGAWYLSLRRSTPPAVTRLAFTLPEGQTFTGTGINRHFIALSPDGAQMLYVGNNRLHLRPMSELDARAIRGTENYQDVSEPVFSPDGRSVAFYALTDQTLKRMAITGGTPVTLCPADNPTGITWGPDGIVFGQGSKGIMRVSPNGGTPDVLVRVKDGELAHGPQLLPGGQHVLFTLTAGTAPDRWDKAHIVVQSVASGERKPLIERGTDARYVPTGHLVYALSGSVFAVAFDVQRLEVSGGSVPIVEGVRRAAGNITGAAQFSFSSTGSLIYVPGPVVASSMAQLDIALMDRKGAVKPLNLSPGPYTVPRVSPDGMRIAFGSDDGNEAIVWTYDLSRTGTMQRLTFGGNNRFPIWTSDGQRIAFQSDRDGDLAIFWQRADGSGTAERLTKPGQGESHAPESWSPKGDGVLFSVTKGSDVSLSMLSVPDRQATPFGAVLSSMTTGAVFSPDGRWVAYSSTERGVTTIYVQPFPATGAKYQLPVKGSESPKQPRWSPDGKQVFYNPNPSDFRAISITTQPTFGFGNAVAVPRLLQLGLPGSRTNYDITLDGQFVGLVTAGQTEYVRGSTNQIQVVLNWFEELKQRTSVQK